MVNRLVHLDARRALVVTDLHGAWDVYGHIRDAFLAMRERGEADTLVFCGDVIHPETKDDPDDSLDLLLDIMWMQQALGEDTVQLLLGNHELPHIYSFLLVKGEMVFTPPFEAALADLDRHHQRGDTEFSRQDVIEFLMARPLYASTDAGVLLSHAGAALSAASGLAMRLLLNFDHQAVLDEAATKLQSLGVERALRGYERGGSYDQDARRFMAVDGPDDPRYLDLLRGSLATGLPAFGPVWDALFTRNEFDGGLKAYGVVVERFLKAISALAPVEQRVLVAGHIKAANGYQLVGTQKLRLASYAHSRPREAGCVLLLDGTTPVATASDLVPMLRRVAEL